MTTENMLTRIPENTSLLQSRKFTFAIPTLPFIRYFGQSISIPAVSTSAPMVPSPLSDMYRHGDKLVYDRLTITAILDEDLRVWEETYNWMLALTAPKEFPQYWRNTNGRMLAYHDTVLTFNNNANIPNMRLKFLYCHPVSISAIQFNTTDSADVIMTCDFTFQYDRFEFERLT